MVLYYVFIIVVHGRKKLTVEASIALLETSTDLLDSTLVYFKSLLTSKYHSTCKNYKKTYLDIDLREMFNIHKYYESFERMYVVRAHAPPSIHVSTWITLKIHITFLAKYKERAIVYII